MNEEKKELENLNANEQGAPNTELTDEALDEVSGGLGVIVTFCKGCGMRKGRLKSGYCDACYKKRFGDGSKSIV